MDVHILQKVSSNVRHNVWGVNSEISLSLTFILIFSNIVDGNIVEEKAVKN